MENSFKIEHMIKYQLNKSIAKLIVLSGLMAGCKPNTDSNLNRTWSFYKGDETSSSYAPLDEINLSNVSRLENVWTFQMSDLPQGEDPVSSQSNPIIVDGVMYANSGKQAVYAIDAATGKEIWHCKTLDEGMPSAASRGVTYWENGDDKRILYSSGNYLMAIDAKTGKIIRSFGNNGRVNLNEGMRDDPEKISVTLSTPGRIFKDLIIIGARTPDAYGAPPGYIRAYNCKTGKLAWTFHTIPHPGEPGYETWPPDAYKYAGGVNCWAGLSIDRKRGMVFLEIRAAIVAFGFVFIHPFEDGNGRLHRFLIHDILVHDGVVPQGLIIPVSAHILNNMRDYDHILEKYSKPLMQRIRYNMNDLGELQVINEEKVEKYFRYPDLTDHCIYLAQTIHATLEQDMPEELQFIQRYDEVKRALQNIVDMPDKDLNLMITFLHQNKGTVPKRRRERFPKLSDEEVDAMQQKFREVFELDETNRQ